MAQSRLQLPGFDELLEGASSLLAGALNCASQVGAKGPLHDGAAHSRDHDRTNDAAIFDAHEFGDCLAGGDHAIFASVLMASMQQATDKDSPRDMVRLLPAVSPPSIGHPFMQLTLDADASPLGPLPMSPIATSSGGNSTRQACERACTIPFLSSPTKPLCTTTAFYASSSNMLWSPGAHPSPSTSPAGVLDLNTGGARSPAPLVTSPLSASPLTFNSPLTTLATLSTLSDATLRAATSPRGGSGGASDFFLAKGKRRASPLAGPQPRPPPRRMELLRLATSMHEPTAPTPGVIVAMPSGPPPGVLQPPAPAVDTAADVPAPTLAPVFMSNEAQPLHDPAAAPHMQLPPQDRVDGQAQSQLERRGSSDSSTFTTNSCSSEFNVSSSCMPNTRVPNSQPSQPLAQGQISVVVVGGSSGQAGDSHGPQAAVAGDRSHDDTTGNQRPSIVLQPFTFGCNAPAGTQAVNLWIRSIATKHGDAKGL